ncbi:MAG: hypothetical protein JWN99_290, partial [Ilumatobacteraceae bacterium]|nr:hypothetical protein [Ilumatobacteraceae bacterium]
MHDPSPNWRVLTDYLVGFMKFLSNARNRWFALAGLWVVLLVLGIGGFLQQASDAGFHRPFLDTLYLTLQLATLDYKGGTDVMNWRLQIARFVAPIISAGTVLQGASVVFTEQFRRFRLRFAREHTIVCGLGDVGTRLAIAFAAAGDTVVAIESDANATGVATAGANGVTVLIGRGSDASLLRVARVDRASRVVAVCGDDATNVQIALATAAVIGSRAGKALRCSVHLTDAELANMLRIADLDARGSVRLSFFNVHERAARSLLAEQPPFYGDHVHVMVFGLGQLGRSMVVALAQQWVEQHPGQQLRLTLVDRSASGRWEALRLQHPALGEVCRPRLLDLDLDAPAAGKVDELRSIFSDDRPSWAVIAFEDESLALSSALFVHQTLADQSVRVVVRTRTDAGLAALLAQRIDGGDTFPGLRAFPFLDRTCTPEAVDGGLRDELARSVHADYLVQTRSDPDAGSGLKQGWAQLDDDQRDLSRRRVDAIVADLASIGFVLSPLRRWGAPTVTFADADVEQLAQREHERWRADRQAAGWTHAAVRDDALKHNP